jgi:hypothetical protein
MVELLTGSSLFEEAGINMIVTGTKRGVKKG